MYNHTVNLTYCFYAGGVLGLAAGAFQWWINTLADEHAAVKNALRATQAGQGLSIQPRGYPKAPFNTVVRTMSTLSSAKITPKSTFSSQLSIHILSTLYRICKKALSRMR